MSQVNLDELEPNAKDDEKKSSGSGSKRSSSRSSARSENDLRNRLYGCFERIANALEERGDEQLAGVIREDAGIMAQGLVSLTRPFMVLRTPLLAVIAIIEPVLAFGRVVRITAERWADRRAQKAEEAELEAMRQQQEAEAAQI